MLLQEGLRGHIHSLAGVAPAEALGNSIWCALATMRQAAPFAAFRSAQPGLQALGTSQSA